MTAGALFPPASTAGFDRQAPTLRFIDAWAPGPDRPDLAPGEIHLWRVLLDASDDASLAVLSATERRRFEGFLRRRDAHQFGQTRAAVRGILSRYLGVAAGEVAFTSTRSGKPGVLAPAGVARGAPFYNVTHSHRLALCAVAGVDVGVDLEWLRPAPMAAGIAAGIVSAEGPIRPDEAPSPERDWRFFQAWTRTEAALKATGEGLAAIDRRPASMIRALAELRPEPYDGRLRISDVPVSLDYIGAVATIDAGAVRTARCWTWQPNRS